MSSEHRSPLIGDALRAIADGSPPPWKDLDAARTDPDRLQILHALDDIAAAYRANAAKQAPPQRRAVLFRWGELEVETLLGQGSFGEVYRAFDPWLGRHVALKLFRDSGSAAGLDEGRRLARLRDRNVLAVYGSAVHDGRSGLWSELVEGQTLSAAVAADGAFSAEETARIGRDLAHALHVVHAAGLVHGDVKAENAMREGGGRIVLMDFGAGGEARRLAGARLISGTPRYLPPEVLDGAPLGTSSDVYALGVLLYLLASGRYPWQAIDAAALREEQRRGKRPALHNLRADLDPALCALIEQCLADDPARRPADAQALSTRFAQLLHPPAQARRLPLAALAIAAVALIAVAANALWPRLFPPAWETSAQFLRVESMGNVDIAANSILRVGDKLRLRLRSSREAYVYVLNEDAAGNATVLYPLDTAAARRPQPADAALTLPGGADSSLAWEVTADSTREEFVVIATLTPQTELENALSGWHHTQAVQPTRSVGAVVDAPAPQVQGERLRRVLAALRRAPAQVRMWQFSFPHSP